MADTPVRRRTKPTASEDVSLDSTSLVHGSEESIQSTFSASHASGFSEDQRRRLAAIRDFITSAERSITSAKKLMASLVDGEKHEIDFFDTAALTSYRSEEDKVVEGIFIGEDGMLGGDGSTYPVPHNYASKSHLVQGSKLKAIIKPDGRIIYKIIGEIEFDTVVGLLTKNRDKYQVVCEGKVYNALLAAVTYIKAEVGDTVSARIPKGKDATFATIVALIPKDM